MDAKSIMWKWYAGGFDDALAGHADKTFQYHHQPFMYYERFKPGSEDQKMTFRITPTSSPISWWRCSASFYKPLGSNNWHPEYASLSAGEHDLEELIKLLKAGPQRGYAGPRSPPTNMAASGITSRHPSGTSSELERAFP